MLKRQTSHAILNRISRFDSPTLTMSAAAAAAAAYTDPSRSLHSRSIVNRLCDGGGGFVHRLNPISNALFKGGGKPNRWLTLRSCFDDFPPPPHHKKAQARALSLHHHHRRLLHGSREERLGGGTTDLADGRGVGNTARLQGSDKIVVAVDIDEVLGNFVSALNKFIADRYLSNHSVSEYHVYEFFRIWNCSRNEADLRVHEFFKTSYFKKGIHPLPGAHKTLHKLSRYCELSVVTSRQNAIKDHTLGWIDMHFPGLFKQIHFGNHFALHGESKPKSEICRSFGAEILIDDNPRYAEECANIGMKVLLFDYENSYPWSKTESVDRHPLVTRVHNWEEVEQQILSWVVTKC
ncbi:Haloacid dehalogenase-like hydrolase (HAD) superfamily protein [Raphanus sativus]|uniref:Uncharacterized protein LOC130508218 n=1 Tax=Raphanus sativus TaxID=3726 RepID=A0A9W3D815_RAPSA|nr:uncharacterized protein LOC130508218 [Raphanus sativus]KAJ4913781.1 Haloacid dehalogenase-like hydrolase (HAD) superfamily protein [Raphanus sativus]